MCVKVVSDGRLLQGLVWIRGTFVGDVKYFEGRVVCMVCSYLYALLSCRSSAQLAPELLDRHDSSNQAPVTSHKTPPCLVFHSSDPVSTPPLLVHSPPFQKIPKIHIPPCPPCLPLSLLPLHSLPLPMRPLSLSPALFPTPAPPWTSISSSAVVSSGPSLPTTADSSPACARQQPSEFPTIHPYSPLPQQHPRPVSQDRRSHSCGSRCRRSCLCP